MTEGVLDSCVRVALKCVPTCLRPPSRSRLAFAPLLACISVSPVMASSQSMQFTIEGRESTGWQPFTFSRRSRIILAGTANGESIKIMLDSGAEHTVIDRGLAKRIKLRQTSSALLNDRGSVVTVPMVAGLKLRIGSLQINELAAAVADLAPVHAVTGVDVGVMLGREIFEEAVIDIDFAGERISFSRPGAYSPPAHAVSTALKRFEAGRGRVVELILEDRLPVQLEFDLGSASPVVLEHPFWSSAKLVSGRRVSNTLIGGVGTIRQAGLISLTSVTLAGIKIGNVDAVLDGPKGILQSKLGNGTIGMPILSQFRVITNYKQSRLYLISHARTNLTRLPRNRSGLRVLHDGGGLRVLLVARDSPAEQGGWRVGERIVAINGHPVDESYWSGDLWRWAEGPVGTKVMLTLADESSRELELNDYY